MRWALHTYATQVREWLRGSSQCLQVPGSVETVAAFGQIIAAPVAVRAFRDRRAEIGKSVVAMAPICARRRFRRTPAERVSR